jgi:hypothetical protein
VKRARNLLSPRANRTIVSYSISVVKHQRCENFQCS